LYLARIASKGAASSLLRNKVNCFRVLPVNLNAIFFLDKKAIMLAANGRALAMWRHSVLRQPELLTNKVNAADYNFIATLYSLAGHVAE
jgi:hypothetical protein